MQNGSTVVITRKGAQPSKSGKPADILLASRAAGQENKAIPNPEGKVVWEPSKSPSGPFSVLLSYADKTVYVWRNGVQIGQAPMSIASGAKPPEGVFVMLEGKEAADSRFPGVEMHPWSVISLDGGSAQGNAVNAIRSHVRLPNDFQKKVGGLLAPGTILVATRESSNKNTRSAAGFTIMKPEAKVE